MNQEDALMSSILFNKAQDFVSIKDIKKKYFIWNKKLLLSKKKNSYVLSCFITCLFLDKQYEALSTR